MKNRLAEVHHISEEELLKIIRRNRLAVDFRYPNRRLSRSEWAAERIVVIPAECTDREKAIAEIREAMQWLMENLDDVLREYDGQSIYDLGYLKKAEGKKVGNV